MLAKFAGTCSRCKQPVNVGEEITWNRKRRGVVYHMTCPWQTGSYSTYEQKITPLAGTSQLSEGEVIYDHKSINQLRSMIEQEHSSDISESFRISDDNKLISTPIETSFQENKSVKQNGNDLAAMLANAISGYLPDSPATVDEAKVREIVKAEMGNIGVLPTRVELKTSETSEVKDLGIQHKQFPTLLTILASGVNVWITGPAGSGKTTAADEASKALGKSFYFCGAQSNEYGLLGFRTATGEVVRTPFREAYENGGVFLFDEVDASAPAALLAFNAALANGYCAFPDGMIPKHKDFIVIAAANTFGLGGTNDYVGRLKQDAAFIDRFVFLSWEYDEALETATAGNIEWSQRVQAVRRNVKAKGIKVIVSPRASYFGAKLLAQGMDQSTVEELVLRKGMDATQWNSVR